MNPELNYFNSLPITWSASRILCRPLSSGVSRACSLEDLPYVKYIRGQTKNERYTRFLPTYLTGHPAGWIGTVHSKSKSRILDIRSNIWCGRIPDIQLFFRGGRSRQFSRQRDNVAKPKNCRLSRCR